MRTLLISTTNNLLILSNRTIYGISSNTSIAILPIQARVVIRLIAVDLCQHYRNPIKEVYLMGKHCRSYLWPIGRSRYELENHE